MTLGTHGVKIKTNDYHCGRWLTPDGGLTTLRIYAVQAPEDRATVYAEQIAGDNPEFVEWARAEVLYKESK